MDAAFGYLAARLLAALLALLAVSAIIFAAVELLPGDLAAQLLGTYATPERIEAVREQLDLDDPARSATPAGSAARCRALSAARSGSISRSRT